MSVILEFTVPGAPFGKGSVRFGRTKVGTPVTFKDAKTVSYMDRVCFYAQAAMQKKGHPWTNPVHVDLELYLVRPGRLLRKKDPVDRIYGPQKPDIDNVCKSVFDAMRAAGVYMDDKQIVSLNVTKWYCEKPTDDGPTVFPRTFVRCWELE